MWWAAGVRTVRKGCRHCCNWTASDTACACERLMRIRTCLGNTRRYMTPGFWIPAASKRHIPRASENTTTLCRSQRQRKSGGTSCVARGHSGICQEPGIRFVGDWPEPADSVICLKIFLWVYSEYSRHSQHNLK